MIYVMNTSNREFNWFKTLEGFKNDFFIQECYKEIEKEVFDNYTNSDYYNPDSPFDVEDAKGYVNHAMDEEHLKETWNEYADQCDISWKILYIGDIDFGKMAEDLIDKYKDELMFYIMRRLAVDECNDYAIDPDDEDDDLTNFVLEHFNRDNL